MTVPATPAGASVPTGTVTFFADAVSRSNQRWGIWESGADTSATASTAPSMNNLKQMGIGFTGDPAAAQTGNNIKQMTLANLMAALNEVDDLASLPPSAGVSLTNAVVTGFQEDGAGVSLMKHGGGSLALNGITPNSPDEPLTLSGMGLQTAGFRVANEYLRLSGTGATSESNTWQHLIVLGSNSFAGPLPDVVTSITVPDFSSRAVSGASVWTGTIRFTAPMPDAEVPVPGPVYEFSATPTPQTREHIFLTRQIGIPSLADPTPDGQGKVAQSDVRFFAS